MADRKRKLPDPSGELKRRTGANRVVKTEIDSGEPGSGSRDDARIDERLPGNAREQPGGGGPREQKPAYRNTDEA
jgi:hypothetical protein